MKDPKERLERAKSLSDSISDGEKTEPRLLEWTSGGHESEDKEEQGFLDALRDIARIAAVHREAGIHSEASKRASPLGRWGHLELVELLGEGSTGILYRARDTELGHEVALKLFRRKLS